MAYDIIGTVYKIGATETIQTRSGKSIQRRSLVLMQQRVNNQTHEQYEPSYPAFEFTNAQELDRYKPGDVVQLRFDVSGYRYNDKQTGEEKFFTSLRAFHIQPYQQYPQPPQQYPQPPQQHPQPPQQQQYQPKSPTIPF